MKKFYISLVKDLIGYYLEVEADSQETVRKYIQLEYFKGGVYTLPWCSVYSEEELNSFASVEERKFIRAKCGPLVASNF